MKIPSLLIIACAIFFLSCHKDNDEPAPIIVSPFAGTYKGTIIDSLYDRFWEIQTDYVITINSTTVAGQVTLTNSPIQADTAIITGTIFTIPKKITNDFNANLRYEEFASGYFSGPKNDTLMAVFNYNSYKGTNGAIGSQFKRTGMFVKQ